MCHTGADNGFYSLGNCLFLQCRFRATLLLLASSKKYPVKSVMLPDALAGQFTEL